MVAAKEAEHRYEGASAIVYLTLVEAVSRLVPCA